MNIKTSCSHFVFHLTKLKRNIFSHRRVNSWQPSPPHSFSSKSTHPIRFRPRSIYGDQHRELPNCNRCRAFVIKPPKYTHTHTHKRETECRTKIVSNARSGSSVIGGSSARLGSDAARARAAKDGDDEAGSLEATGHLLLTPKHVGEAMSADDPHYRPNCKAQNPFATLKRFKVTDKHP